MPSKPKSLLKRNAQTKMATEKILSANSQNKTITRCTKCGSRTVRLEQLQQELLAVLAVHCLICGHHRFVGKPIVRLIRKPELPHPTALKENSVEV